MIIDVRLRPLYGGFLRQVQNPTSADFSAQLGMVKPRSVCEQSLELMLQEMDAAGVTMGVIPGRNGHFKGTIANDDIIKLLDDFPGRFVGTAGLNASKKEEALEEIERTVVNGPLKGVCMEPGALDRPMYADDPRIYPIYEKCEKHEIPVILMLGGRAGPDITYSDPKIINRIAADFPRTNFIISHGGWPWVQQILGVCFFQKNIYLCPDMYLFNCSGAADYIMAANNFMQDRFLYGSAYPLMPIVDCVEHFRKLFKPEVLPKLLWKNAARVLKLDLPEQA